MMRTFVCLVPVDITRLVTPAQNALRRVALEQEKRLFVLQHRTVFVLQTFVLAPMALKQRAQHVPPTMLTFVRTVTMGFTKTALPVRTLTIVHQTHVATKGSALMELKNTRAIV